MFQSAAAYRALLNLAYRWFEPGRTHFPVGRGKRQFWAQVNDAKRYPALTDDELIALCFPHFSTQPALEIETEGAHGNPAVREGWGNSAS